MATSKTRPAKPRKKAANPGHFPKGRRPHNAAPAPELTTLDDLVIKIASEPRQVLFNGEAVTMSLMERRFRSEIEAAFKGDARALSRLIKLMMRYPVVVRTTKTQRVTIISGPLANV